MKTRLLSALLGILLFASTTSAQPPTQMVQILPMPPERAFSADVDWGPYRADVIRQLRKSWHRQTAGKRSAVIKFQLNRDGKQSHIAVERSSGNTAFDRGAVHAVEMAAFRLFPQTAPDTVHVRVTFGNHLLHGETGSQTIPGPRSGGAG